MNRQMLKDYADACEFVREIQEDMKRLDSQQGFCCTEQADQKVLFAEQQLLEERKKRAENLKLEVEAWINTVPLRLQRIIRYRFMLGCTWRETADYMKGRATENGLKKEFERFMDEHCRAD